MNIKRILALLLSSIITTIIIIALLLNNNSNKVSTKYFENSSGLSVMYETKAGSGEYIKGDNANWNTTDYVFNEEKSYCEKGSTLSWDEENKVIKMSTNKSDSCKIYFDKIIKKISFTIMVTGRVQKEISGTAEEDMMWNEWLNSSYYQDVDHFMINDSFVRLYFTAHGYYGNLTLNDNTIKPTDKIIDKTTYNVYASGFAGEEN